MFPSTARCLLDSGYMHGCATVYGVYSEFTLFFLREGRPRVLKSIRENLAALGADFWTILRCSEILASQWIHVPASIYGAFPLEFPHFFQRESGPRTLRSRSPFVASPEEYKKL